MDTPNVAAIRRLVEMRIRTGRAKGNRVISLGIRDAEILLAALDVATRERDLVQEQYLGMAADALGCEEELRTAREERAAVAGWDV